MKALKNIPATFLVPVLLYFMQYQAGLNDFFLLGLFFVIFLFEIAKAIIGENVKQFFFDLLFSFVATICQVSLMWVIYFTSEQIIPWWLYWFGFLTCFLDVIISSTITYRMLSRDINLSP
jgi:hypothetical protein